MHTSRDHRERRKDENCPECEKAQKHVKMVESDGKMVCPECRYEWYLLKKR